MNGEVLITATLHEELEQEGPSGTLGMWRVGGREGGFGDGSGLEESMDVTRFPGWS